MRRARCGLLVLLAGCGGRLTSVGAAAALRRPAIWTRVNPPRMRAKEPTAWLHRRPSGTRGPPWMQSAPFPRAMMRGPGRRRRGQTRQRASMPPISRPVAALRTSFYMDVEGSGVFSFNSGQRPTRIYSESHPRLYQNLEVEGAGNGYPYLDRWNPIRCRRAHTRSRPSIRAADQPPFRFSWARTRATHERERSRFFELELSGDELGVSHLLVRRPPVLHGLQRSAEFSGSARVHSVLSELGRRRVTSRTTRRCVRFAGGNGAAAILFELSEVPT